MSDEASSAAADAGPGDKVAGYRLEEKIGQGGMAVVYRAYDERLERRVALKLLAPGLTADTAFRARFIRESRAAAAVDHPNIIPVYDAGDAGGFLFIAMRYVQGGDVKSLISAGQPLSPARVWHIVTQVGAALDAAHAHQLVHRDVKPANMLLDAGGATTGAKTRPSGDDSREHVYLSDFGISKQTLASHLTSTGQFVGTLDYIAPEQIEGQSLDGRADQYALACTAFELLSGVPPFLRNGGLALINAHLSEQPPSVVAKRPELPAAVDRVISKAMAKSPDLRYESCADFAADLGRALGLIPGTPGVGQPAAAVPGARQPTELAMPVAVPEPTQAVTPAQVAAATMSPVAPQVPVAAPAGMDAATMAAVPPGMQQAQPGQFVWPGQQPAQPGAGTPPQGTYQPGTYQPGTYQPGAYPPSGPQYPQPGGPSGPQGWPQQPPPKKSRGVLIGVIAGIVVVAVAVAAFVLLGKKNNSAGPSVNTPPVTTPATTPPTSPATTTPALTAQSEATGMNNLLLNSANTLSQLGPTVTDVQNCGNLSSDVSELQQIASARAGELSSAEGLQTGAIPNGALLESQLLTALRISLRIDRDYLAWARRQQNSGCGSASAAYNQANNLDPTASGDKSAFLGTWNPIREQYGFPQLTTF